MSRAAQARVDGRLSQPTVYTAGDECFASGAVVRVGMALTPELAEFR